MYRLRVSWLAVLYGCSAGSSRLPADAAADWSTSQAGALLLSVSASEVSERGTAVLSQSSTSTNAFLSSPPLSSPPLSSPPLSSPPLSSAADSVADERELAGECVPALLTPVDAAPFCALPASTPTPPIPPPVVGPSPPPAPVGPLPALTPELHALRRAAQDRVLGRSSPTGLRALAYADAAPELGARGAPFPALARFVPMDNEAALQPFHQALAELAAGRDPDRKVRILAYGASHTQADIYPAYLRAYLQSRFGDGGQGFVLLGRVNRWHRVPHTRARQHALSVHHAYFRRDSRDEPLGLFGAALVGRSGDAFAELVTAKQSLNTRFTLQYSKQVGGGDFDVLLDGASIARVPTQSDTLGPGAYPFEARTGAHTIRAQLRGNGLVRLFGVIAETAHPGVVVDTLGIGGSDMASNLRWHEALWSETLRERKPDLVTFAYGTNETMNPGRALIAYEAELRGVLSRFRRALPATSCLLISPFDLTRAVRERLLRVVDAQRRVSKEFGCAFWDGYAFMGGAGAMRRWASAKPALAARDHIHLTPLGYVYAGIGISDALMRAYDSEPNYWLRSGPVLSSVSPPALSSPAPF